MMFEQSCKVRAGMQHETLPNAERSSKQASKQAANSELALVDGVGLPPLKPLNTSKHITRPTGVS